jgi:LacI family transcriptional regulator
MNDVARLAGVSPMTVSRVVNGTGTVRDDTRRKVGVAMAALNFMPNRQARNLAGSKPARIGFLYSSLFGADLGEFLVGLLSQSSLDNVQLFVERCTAPEGQAAQLRRMLGARMEGLILGPLYDNAQAAAAVAASGMPAVLVDAGRIDERLGSIGIDSGEAARHMTRHLLALGHQRIGFVSGSALDAVGAARLAGYRAALEQAGVDRDDRLVVLGKTSYRCGLDAGELLLGLSDRPTAIFAGNDDMAAAVVAAAHAQGLGVPGDLTVTGFGDTRLATTIWPELTTIRLPSAQMARDALQSLVRRVRALRRGARCEPEHLNLDFELVRRQSDAAPRVRPLAVLPAMAGKTLRR